MTPALAKLLRAIRAEFGQCPSWQKLIDDVEREHDRALLPRAVLNRDHYTNAIAGEATRGVRP